MRKKRKSLKAKRPLRYAAAALALALTFVSISAAAFARSDGENAETSGSGDVSAAALALSEEETKSIQILNITGSGAVVAGAVFTLKGTGDDGTYYEESQATDEEGRCAFTVPKAGTYALCQSDVSGASPSVTGDGIVRALHVDEDGTVTLDEKEAASDGSFIITSAAYSSGTVSVIKKWITDNTDALYDDEGAPVLPTVYLSEEDPNSGITVTFIMDEDAEFSFTYNSTEYAASDGMLSVSISEGETLSEIIGTQEPSLSGYSFTGWYSDSSFGTAFLYSTSITEDITLYAKFSEYAVKYAVSIYGIEEDVYTENSGKSTTKTGLTFGPATGYSYVSQYASHTPSGTTSGGNAKRCIHDDTWAEIIYWSETDPYVYEDCISGGTNSSDGTTKVSCTKSITIELNETTANSSYDFSDVMSGDGTGTLYASLGSAYRCWHNSMYTLATSSTSGAWPNSTIYALLNGETALGETTIISSSSLSILAGFPADLQEAIVSTKTTSSGTSYDKLWFMSFYEYFSDKSSMSEPTYTRQSTLKIKTSSGSGGYIYNENGSTQLVWLNTAYASLTDSSASLTLGGSIVCVADYTNYYIAGTYYIGTSMFNGEGVSPCFCLK